MPMPNKDEIQLENPTLYAVLAVGYDDDAQCIWIVEAALIAMYNFSCIMTISWIDNELMTFGRLKRLVKANVPMS